MHLPSSKSESGHDLKKFLDVIAGLWVLPIVGAWCNFLTLFYIGRNSSITIQFLGHIIMSYVYSQLLLLLQWVHRDLAGESMIRRRHQHASIQMLSALKIGLEYMEKIRKPTRTRNSYKIDFFYQGLQCQYLEGD
ncbi:hypothetical protein MKW98_003598 [Papaver atlanticum]|uniref:Reticulon-like protein n=1 Tax=Papaver atlanticum TaxID=357466 RepID=A0AAD4SJP0_9MAGN|nr:hypothetical protein MKW98_003598 [Papaver atlanticum]